MKFVPTLALTLFAGAANAAAGIASAGSALDESAPAEVRRFALVAGANDGGPARVRLRYAATDAEAFAQVLDELGGLASEDRLLLLEPDREQLLAGLAQLSVMLASAEGDDVRRELVVYYSGHSDEQGLLLGRERLPYRELRRAIDALPADVRVTILDSCASGTLTREKGGKMHQPFLVDRSTDVRGYAILTSASADEAAQESDRIGGSFFTHSLVTGLRGAADTTGDGRVTLNEAYQFAFHETLARTEGTRSGAQHPNYDFRLVGSGDLVLTDLRETTAGLRLPEGLAGRVFVRDAEGRLVAELRKPGGRAMLLGLPPGVYGVMLDDDGRLSRGEVTLTEHRQTPLEAAALQPVEGEVATARGGTSGPTRRYFNLALAPGLGTNDLFEGPVVNTVSIGLIGARAHGVEGVAASGAVDWVDDAATGAMLSGAVGYVGGEMGGVQLAGAAAIAGSLRGGQLAGAANVVRGPVGGVQAAGGANVATGDVGGVQAAGGVNVAVGDVTGLQVAGGVNVAVGDVTGLQLAPINRGGRVKGLQIGVVNVAEHVDGLPLGLINWVDDGMRHVAVWGADHAPLNAGFKLGNHWFYTQLLVGTAFGADPRTFAGMSLGGRLDLDRAWVNLDLAHYNVFEEGFTVSAGQLSKASLTVGWRFAGDLAAFAGPALNVHIADGARQARAGEDLAFGPQQAWRSGDVTVRMWPGALLGLEY